MIISIATGPWLPVPAVQGGAIPRMWQGLAEEFAARGHQVNILCRAFPGQPSTEVIQGVKYTRWSGFSQCPNIKLDLIKDLFYALLTTPTLPSSDILVINDFWLPVFAALHPKVRKIVINVNRFPKGQYWLYAKTDFFAAASNAIQEAIIQQYPAATPRIRVIPNPIDTQTFTPSHPTKSNPTEKIILYVGRLHPEKGVHLLIDAFSIASQTIKDIKLRIIGPWKCHQGGAGQEYLKSLHAQASGLNVEILDPIFDKYYLAEAYRNADLFCYPSLAEKGESFGVAPLEAMACGLVPIVSDLECFRDFIQNRETGYFFDHRSFTATENLASILTFALLNWKDTREVRERAIKQASQYSYPAVADTYIEQFNSLLNHSKYPLASKTSC